MNIIQNRTLAVQNAQHLLNEHPMCGCLLIDHREFTVIYPDGDFGVPYGGIKHHTGEGKLRALTALLEKCEEDWKGSFL